MIGAVWVLGLPFIMEKKMCLGFRVQGFPKFRVPLKEVYSVQGLGFSKNGVLVKEVYGWLSKSWARFGYPKY